MQVCVSASVCLTVMTNVKKILDRHKSFSKSFISFNFQVKISNQILNVLLKDFQVESLYSDIPVSYTHLTLPTNREV